MPPDVIEHNHSAEQQQTSELTYLSLLHGETPSSHQQTGISPGDRTAPNPVSPDGAIQFGSFDQLYANAGFRTDKTAPGAPTDQASYGDLTPEQIAKSRKHDAQDPNDPYNENANQHFPGIQNSFEVIPDVLYRGANPGGCNDATHPWTPESEMQGLQTLKSKGITTVVDFETGDSKDPLVAVKIATEKADCEKLGMTFVGIPMDPHDVPTQAQRDLFIKTIEDTQKAGGQVYCHCREGRDRTGYMVAQARMALPGQGWSADQARAEDESHGYNPFKQQKYPNLQVH